MTTNLIERFNQSVGDQLVSRLSGYLGEPTEHTKSAIQSSLPGLLGTLLKKMGTPKGASSLVVFLQEEQMNGNLLSNMSTLFTGGEATEGLLSQGDKVLDFIFGKNNPLQSNLVDYLSTRDGINRGASSTLLRLISPMMMGIIGRHANENDLKEEGLSKLLAEQKTYIQEIVPKGFFQEIGLHTLEKSQPEKVQVEGSTAEPDEVVAPPKSSILKKIGPWLLLGSLALGMLLAMRACGGRPDGINSMAVESASDSTKTENAIPDSMGDESKETRKEVPSPLGIASLKSIHDHLYGLSGDENSRYDLDEVFFRGQSSVLTAPSMRPLDHLAALLQAYDDKQVRIEGFAYLAGDTSASARLGEDRAVAVKDALIELGVDSSRLEASGFSTPASKQENELLKRKEWVSIGLR